MDTVYLVLILLFVASATGVATRFLPSLPTPLILIGFGAVIAWPASGLHVELEPELFMLLFIAPLLFADARRFPQREFMILRGPILALALGLVLVTVIGVGYFVHWLFPALPLAVCFALTAILSPTDAVAVSAISGRLPVPPRLMHILEGESLMNDASGLVAFKFAVAAALTGAFSLTDAASGFFIISVGGIFVGIALALAFNFVRTRLIERRLGEASTIQVVLLLLLLPFAAFLLAEHFHMSGILSAVAAGMVINRKDLKRQDQTSTRIQARSVWEMLEFVLNALVFLLLGFQLPEIIGGALHFSERNGGAYEFIELLGYVVLISTALLGMRFVWICGATYLPKLISPKAEVRVVSKRVMLAGTLAGIRGTITLAAALSLPELMNDGTPFPARELLIFLATGVILFTLVSGSIGLPLVLRNLDLPKDSKEFEEEHDARVKGAEAAIRRIEQYSQEKSKTLADHKGHEEVIIAFNEVILQLMDYYHKRLEVNSNEVSESVVAARRELERETRLQALKAERGEYYRLRSKNIINDSTLRKLVREVDLVETALNASIAETGH